MSDIRGVRGGQPVSPTERTAESGGTHAAGPTLSTTPPPAVLMATLSQAPEIAPPNLRLADMPERIGELQSHMTSEADVGEIAAALQAIIAGINSVPLDQPQLAKVKGEAHGLLAKLVAADPGNPANAAVAAKIGEIVAGLANIRSPEGLVAAKAEAVGALAGVAASMSAERRAALSDTLYSLQHVLDTLPPDSAAKLPVMLMAAGLQRTLAEGMPAGPAKDKFLGDNERIVTNLLLGSGDIDALMVQIEEATNQLDQAQMATKGRMIEINKQRIQQNVDDQLKKIADYFAKLEEANKSSWFGKIFGAIAAVLGAVASLATGGLGTIAMIALAVSVLQQTGAMNEIFKGIGIDEKTAGWINLGLGVLALAGSGGNISQIANAVNMLEQSSVVTGALESVVGKEAAGWIMLGLNLVLMAASMKSASGAAGKTTKTVEEGVEMTTMGASRGAAATGAVEAGTAAGGGTDWGKILERGSRGLGGVSELTSGAFQVKAGFDALEVANLDSDRAQLTRDQLRMKQQMDDMIEELKALMEKIEDGVQQTVSTLNSTADTISHSMNMLKT